jgi:hypothetical protein
MNWYLILDNEKQLLYTIDRPRFHFKEKSKKPSWFPLHIEIPTRPLETIFQWMKEKYPARINLIELNEDNSLVENWILEKAFVEHYQPRNSRVLNYEVLVMVIKYEWARKIK